MATTRVYVTYTENPMELITSQVIRDDPDDPSKYFRALPTEVVERWERAYAELKTADDALYEAWDAAAVCQCDDPEVGYCQKHRRYTNVAGG